jgi:hypothetical protein
MLMGYENDRQITNILCTFIWSILWMKTFSIDAYVFRSLLHTYFFLWDSVLGTYCCCNHKFESLKQYKFSFYFSPVKWVHWAKNRIQEGLDSFLEILEENLVSCLLHLLEATCIPWLIVPSSVFKTINGHSSLPHDTTCLILFYKLFHYSYVHTRLGSFLPHAPTPSLTTYSTSSLSPSPPQYPAETILPLSLILLKREYKQ